MPRELVLFGGGHAHIEVIRRWGLDPIAGVRLRVYDPNPRPVYSGMVPGFVAAEYEQHELEIDLAGLCQRAGADFIPSAVASLDAATGQFCLGDGTPGRYDVASLDIGSTVAGTDLPGVRERALPSRPIAALVSDVGSLIERAKAVAGQPFLLHVVGGGAGGVELAFCLDARLRRERERVGVGAADFEVTLVTGDTRVLDGAARGLRSRVERALRRRGIQTLASSRVAAILEDAIEFEGGHRVASSGSLWVTGPASHRLAADSGLPIDARGFVRTHPTLQVQGYDDLFAVGDCASLPGMKKAGVYAVRSGPLVDYNIRAVLRDEPLREYSPQSDFLSLLNLGDGTAIGSKWGVAVEGRSILWLKDRIDRSFMRRY